MPRLSRANARSEANGLPAARNKVHDGPEDPVQGINEKTDHALQRLKATRPHTHQRFVRQAAYVEVNQVRSAQT